ncbi:uncharacterized protein LOC130453296 [Diorhabda sublineata]|uniref:uncharacterized protein LOC130453296 n=1 Tax=Diorhabda sublineata TaxID=1163346 RepID=UPI0024E192F7|nr:uncharacterized protein LOC130453296 [Diorhabda sublineata]
MRRSRSPRRHSEQMDVETFSISSLSDISVGELIQHRDEYKSYNRGIEKSSRRRREHHVSDKRARSEYLQNEENVQHFPNNLDMLSDPSIFEYKQTSSYRPPTPGPSNNGRIDKRKSLDGGKRKFEDREYKRSTSDRHGDRRSFDRIEYTDRRHNDEPLDGKSSKDERRDTVSKPLNDEGSSKSDDRIDRLERMIELLVHSKSLATNIDSSQKNKDIVEAGGKNTKISTSLWLNEINEYCLDRNYDDTACINYLQTKMSGLMKAWFKTLNVFEYTWPELKMLITKTFPDTFDFASALRLLVDRIKRPDETITEYYFAKMYLIEYCKISGMNAVSCLIDGLNDPYLQNQAKEYNFLTPETLYSQFLVKIPNYGLSAELPEPESLEEEYEERNLSYSTTTRDNPKSEDMNNKKCYTCGKIGHIAEVCRHAPLCYKCRKRGHIAVKCPNKYVELKRLT